MDKANHLEDWARAPPAALPLGTRVLKMIYDTDDSSLFGRTPKRWGIILAFYLVFYAVLAVMFSLCMGGLLLSLDPRRPKFTLDDSLIMYGASPGVAQRPRSPDGLLLRYNVGNDSHASAFLDEMEDIVRDTVNASWARSAVCTAADNYGYPDTPCFYIKLNKIYGWMPQYYSDAAALPADMPPDLAQHIRALDETKRKQLWVSCWDEAGNATLEYPWGRGLPGGFYPYLNEPAYRSPVLAMRLTVPRNVAVTVRCRVWARNIIYNKSLKEPSGYTRFQVLLEDAGLAQ